LLYRRYTTVYYELNLFILTSNVHENINNIKITE